MIVENIRQHAKAQGMSITDVEEACNLGKRTLYRWDTNSPAVDKVKTVAEFFGVTVDELIKDTEQENGTT